MNNDISIKNNAIRHRNIKEDIVSKDIKSSKDVGDSQAEDLSAKKVSSIDKCPKKEEINSSKIARSMLSFFNI